MPQEMRFAPLFSGSSGNSIYIGCGNTHILTDAGMSGSRITAELAKIGVTPDMLSGIIATHEHSDHIKGVGILSRKYDLPIYATEGTWQGMDKLIGAVSAKNRRVLTPEQDFYIGDLNVTPFATPHDANEPIGLSFACGCARFSIATDIGCVRAGWLNHVLGSDAVLLESNYDPDMLKAGSYPYDLKRRILSNRGHLCNEDAGKCAAELARAGARHIILGHLSRENNFPELALRCCLDALRAQGVDPQTDVRVDVASRDGITGIFGISAEF